QLDGLIFRGFVTEFGSRRLADLPRYLAAATKRLSTLPSSAGRDAAAMDVLDRVYGSYGRLLDSLPESRKNSPGVQELFWMIEELRVGLFAQGIRTAYPVSEKRIEKAIADQSR
ncbi:MAG: DUF3418 domain-containing protein, partial [Rhodococcus sp.]|nr:DUF3418 domain-containing protein [Rhodococcus sp. (in: high G+C Gram-positive bacteria)]